MPPPPGSLPLRRAVLGALLLLLLAVAGRGLSVLLAPAGTPPSKRPASPPAPAESSLTLVFAGDVILDRGVAAALRARGAPALAAALRPFLADADLAFLDLETPLSDTGAPRIKEVTFRSDPALAPVLADAGVDVVSLANNHSGDYGPAALRDTLRHLDAAGIAHCGAGPDLAAAMAPAILERHGVRVAYVGFCEPFWGVAVAGDRAAGIAPTDTAVIVNALRAARARADLVIASFHWDWEYDFYPDQETKLLARLAVAHGADLVIGHHPHVIQGSELVDGIPVAYSLGNFVFDQKRPRCREHYVRRVTYAITRTGGRVTALRRVSVADEPTEINPATCLPETPPPARRAELERRLRVLSAGLAVPR